VISCAIVSARMLRYKYLCSSHFSESDFTTASNCIEGYESQLGCTDYEPYCCSRPQWLQVKTNALYVMKEVANENNQA
jgi:hypothetical protein